MENENQAIKIIKELYYEKMISQLIIDIISKSILLLIYFMIAYSLNFPRYYYIFKENGLFTKEFLLSKELIFPLVITLIFSLYIEIYHEIKRMLFKTLAFDKFIINQYIQNETFRITMARYNNHLDETPFHHYIH